MLQKTNDHGWATLELILLLPITVALLTIVITVGQYFTTKLELINATNAVATFAGIEDPENCNTVASSEFGSYFSKPATVSCQSNDTFVKVTAKHIFKSEIVYLDNFEKEMIVTASAARNQKVE